VNPIGPRACYDEGKRVAETMMYAYHGQSNVDVSAGDVALSCWMDIDIDIDMVFL
jgi:hypothetical protein